MTRATLIALLAVNALAAAAIFAAGRWVGQTNRYDDCQVVQLAGGVGYLCGIGGQPQPPPERQTGGEA